jgi:hypothetical protein
MRLHFTGDGRQSYHRIRYLWGALIRNGHSVHRSRSHVPARRDREVWFHDVEYQFPFTDALLEPLLAFPGEVVLYRTDDTPDFPLEKLPAELVRRARLFLGPHWEADPARIPSELEGRIGYVNPILDPLPAHAGSRLADRAPRAAFLGVRTGGENLPDGRNARETGLRLLRDAGVPIEGGLVSGVPSPPPDLEVERVPRRVYRERLDGSRVCLCLWSFAPLTYRLFEGFSRRNLVITQSLASARFADGGMRAGEHYVEVAPDLSDLVDVVIHHLEQPDESQRIADAGHELFRRHFGFRGLDLPQPLFEEITATWDGLLVPPRTISPARRLLGKALPHISKLPRW